MLMCKFAANKPKGENRFTQTGWRFSILATALLLAGIIAISLFHFAPSALASTYGSCAYGSSNYEQCLGSSGGTTGSSGTTSSPNLPGTGIFSSSPENRAIWTVIISAVIIGVLFSAYIALTHKKRLAKDE